MAKPKLSDVAALAGVSPTTVSRVLNNRGYLSEATRTKVHEAVQQLGYRPNAIARSLQVSVPRRWVSSSPPWPTPSTERWCTSSRIT